MRQRAVTYGQRNRHSTGQQHRPQRRGGGSPLGGRTGHNPARLGAQAPGLLGWAGANTMDCAERA
jgi:hypothetical protein